MEPHRPRRPVHAVRHAHRGGAGGVADGQQAARSDRHESGAGTDGGQGVLYQLRAIAMKRCTATVVWPNSRGCCAEGCWNRQCEQHGARCRRRASRGYGGVAPTWLTHRHTVVWKLFQRSAPNHRFSFLSSSGLSTSSSALLGFSLDVAAIRHFAPSTRPPPKSLTDHAVT